ncbi:carboxymuconolactone decarboxylase family protein [Agrobacterium vitis]|uniref:carboxymuconolactone decarboxylase family protein n=1 Tax=Agrobacterium vitis TaxID=373 RepID=UPI001F3E8DF1|nr:carboxymuconolactone decarboxylase family protein [Agrobacterium vitis]MCF1469602.1 carboxymuconolactone decarboxylase family protein [Agrobacterium vitis]
MRLTDLQLEDMSPAQQSVAEEAKSGRRGHIPAPLRAWIHSPELGARAERLGEFVRYNTELGADLSELAILVVARDWGAIFEWDAHKREALKAGIEPHVIEAIRTRTTPAFPSDKARIVYCYTKTLLETRFIPSPLHDEAVTALGQAGLAELVGVVGYYTFVAMTLNAFEIGVEEGSGDLGVN